MNPFESARTEASLLRNELKSRGVGLDQSAFAIAVAACKHLDVALKRVRKDFPLLKGADATINVVKKWCLIRNDVEEEEMAFLVAHEIGHLRLHPSITTTVEVSKDALMADADTNGVKEVESYGARERAELQANVFAREFLLPREIGREQFMVDRLGASEIAALRKLPLELVRLQLYDAVLLPSPSISAKTYQLPDLPTEAQRPAVCSDAKTTLIEAGPGTGKTTTLLLRLRRLIAQGAEPASIVVLTFSNKAARELVERARAGGIRDADKVWIGTFHAFGLEFLRKFGELHGLGARFPVLDKLAALAMLESDLPSLELNAFDPLANPSPWLENVFDAIRRSKDEVFNSSTFASAVAAERDVAELDAKREDVARIFERYELLLTRRKAVDLNDLLGVSIGLMQSDDPGVLRFLAGIQHVMVDEYQDVNRASALLVKQLSRYTKTLWVVGDANQAIYGFMGASSTNLRNFQTDFPGAISIPLALNHRSSQEIVDTFTAVARRNPSARAVIELEAERKHIGHGPRHVHTSNELEQLDALAARIRQIESQGIPLSEQAIIVYRNSTAADLAAGLQDRNLPVLYLGNIFERPEIKDLICVLQLAVDSYGINLVRQWHSPLLRVSRAGADLIFSQTRSEECTWIDASDEGLSPDDSSALQRLRRLCSLVTHNMSPWDALAGILLEDGEWLRELAARNGQAAANALMAVWQFVHFCRAPDGTGRWATVRNLPQRIRDRIRLNEDRSLRQVPPEAEGMNAVRVLTAHGSKGLEFDAVHLLEANKRTFETPQNRSNPLVPNSVVSRDSTIADLLKAERHNLLYVAVSRPRSHLTVYTLAEDELPSALSNLLEPLDHGCATTVSEQVQVSTSVRPEPEVTLAEYVTYTRCPRRHENLARAGHVQRDELKIHRAIEVATRRAMRTLKGDPGLLGDREWPSVVTTVLAELELDKHSSAAAIQQRVNERVRRGRELLLEGSLASANVPMTLGALKVTLEPDQVFEAGGTRRVRFIRSDNNESALRNLKQPLAALLDAHHAAGGSKTAIEVATLADGILVGVGTVRAPTRERYRNMVKDLCAGNFPASPNESRTCHFCPFMFPCDKRTSE